ncbi:hypothetical protein HNQ93_001259 [Hymenobacter luteus]|uniref:DNA-directed DNA polymerase family A palm domain-containing protein n=2 Tax=Hymenobacter TaxID=89966 RepID=A0A7W9T0G1_9BACT|nr:MULTISPECIES: hypothetical protein [Hymenobacter]MBB4601380.1 hypothetical protein [Hymenobacter latericoloratus]MBB6058413.1 hypothetical protein [Hymenobacter luteus]
MFLYTYLYTEKLTLLREKQDEDPDFPGYVQISRSIQRSFLGDDYSEVMKLLLDNDFLTMLRHNREGEYFQDGFYFKGDYTGRCKSFKIPEHLQGTEKLYKVLREHVGQRELLKLNTVSPERQAYEERYRQIIAQNMKNVILLDTPESRQKIEDILAAQNKRVTPQDFITLFNTTPIKENPICEFGHRVHSNIVNTHKVVRPWYRFRGDEDSPLVEIDLVNSQPAILASITPKLIMKFAPECTEAAPLYAKVANDTNYQHYQELCATGDIYEQLRDRFNETYGSKLLTSLTRNDAKGVYYRGAYSDYEVMERYDLAEAEMEVLTLILQGAPQAEIDKKEGYLFTLRSYLLFKDMFPSVHELFRKIKLFDWKGINPGNKHSNNCLLAQRIESGIIYTRVVKALIDAGIERTKIITLHDALMVREQDEKKARTIFAKELKKLHLNIKLKNK